MKYFITFHLLLIFGYFNNAQKITPSNQSFKKRQISNDSLFQLNFLGAGNVVQITPPENFDLYFPDSDAELEPYKLADFNNDGKKDVLINLGECGTGGCMYGLFLNKLDSLYSLAYLDYLKNPDFEKEENGCLVIKSLEETRAYDPSSLNITIYKFDKTTHLYEHDTTFVTKDYGQE